MLPGSTTVSLRTHAAGAPLKKQFSRGFVYSDGWVDDARLVLLNAMDAQRHGATVLTRTACVDAQRSAQGWTATLRGSDGTTRGVRARALVNAAGPWAAQFLAEHAHAARGKSLRLVKGSHVIVRKVFDHPYAAKTDEKGEFTLKNLPTDVDLQVVYWHPTKGFFGEGGQAGKTMRFKSGANDPLNITISP